MKVTDKKICAYCNESIEDGSLCRECMSKYDIRPSEVLDDGCGCDTK